MLRDSLDGGVHVAKVPVAGRQPGVAGDEGCQHARHVLGEAFHALALDEPLHCRAVRNGLLQIRLEALALGHAEHPREHLRGLRRHALEHLVRVLRSNAARNGVVRVFLGQNFRRFLGLGLCLEHAEERTIRISVIADHRLAVLVELRHIHDVLPEAHQRRIAFLLELADLVGLAGEAVTHGLQAIDLIGQFCGLLRMACLHLREHGIGRLRASKGFDEALHIVRFGFVAQSHVFGRHLRLVQLGVDLVGVEVKRLAHPHSAVGNPQLRRPRRACHLRHRKGF